MYQSLLVVMIISWCYSPRICGQQVAAQLKQALLKLATDEQFKHAALSMYVINSKTGDMVVDYNGQAGMAPASCQKVITSVTAFELLGKDYQYKTYIDYDRAISNGVLAGSIYIKGGGDPTLGSNRWNTTREPVVLKKIKTVLEKKGIKSVAGGLVADDIHFTSDQVPRGWIWEDMGNYYGAGAWGLNWRENQYDITFQTGKENERTQILTTDPAVMKSAYAFTNFITTGKKGSGDNGYLFAAPFQKNIIARGTVPPSEKGFTISGSMPDPPQIFVNTLKTYLAANNIHIAGEAGTYAKFEVNNLPSMPMQRMDSIVSPPLDSINYWFLKKSVNLFGEALVKTIAVESKRAGNTDSGLAIIKEFWNKKGIEKSALKMIDGSGLSPANKVTAHALATVMQYARGRQWFNNFFNALPEMNGIKMKDGYITGVRSYAGYIDAKDGTAYAFAFIVNNFDGSAGTVREKMWKVLDLLK